MRQKYLIILTGIDGAGKTTQSKLLKNFLENVLTARVNVIHFEPPMWLTILQLSIIKHVRNQSMYYSSNYNKKNYDKNSGRDGIFKVLYALFYLYVGILFYAKLLLLLLRFNCSRKIIIICDRYPLIDGLAYICFRTQNIPLSIKLTSIWSVFELILQKISIPQCLLLLINPELTLGRRPEHNLKRQKTHQLLINYFCSNFKPRFISIDVSNETIMAVHKAIVAKVLRLLRT